MNMQWPLPDFNGPILLALALLVSGLTGCDNDQTGTTAGDRERGKALITSYGCGSCHRIPGVRGANGEVGPRLKDIHSRAYLGGVIPNNFDNLVLWLTETRQIAPGSAMPSLGITPEEAEHIAAYLYQPD